jgi:hypothetical protein
MPFWFSCDELKCIANSALASLAVPFALSAACRLDFASLFNSFNNLTTKNVHLLV